VNGNAQPSGTSFKRRVPIHNAWKVWGTMKSATCSTIGSAIKMLTFGSLVEKLTIKRKFKSEQNGSIKKW